MKTCTIDGCDKAHRAKGLCGTHYGQQNPNRHRKATLSCDRCGKTFIREDRSNRYTGTYCTWACRSEARWGELHASRKQVSIYAPAPMWHRVVTGMQTAAPARARTFIAGDCVICGDSFLCLYGSKTCGDRCQEEHWASVKRDAKHRRRARQKQAFIAPVSRHRIYKRDQWICQLCHEPVDMTASVPSMLAPTIDHIIPLARGGAHAPHNVQTAHFICNSRKGDRAELTALHAVI